MPTAIQPLDLLTAKRTVPSDMRTAEWSRLGEWTRERSFYLAGVARAEIVQEMRGMVARSARGDAGEYELRKEWEKFLGDVNYRPEPGQEGTIKDLRSLRRFNVALRTNKALMNGWAMRENGLRPGPLRAQPAYELIRLQAAKVPRDWIERFVAAGGRVINGRLIAPKLSDVWPALGDVARFEDALGVSYPPFAWGSGMDWGLVGAREAMEIGAMTREEILAQIDAVAGRPVASPNESMETRPRVTDPDLRDELAEQLDGLAEWVDDRLVFTDPNGTRPVSDEGLVETWSRPLPEQFRTEDHPAGLFQRDSVLVFADDPERFVRRTDSDAWEDLARAVSRITPRADQRRILSRLADRADTSWVGTLTSSPLWGAAMEISSAAPRAVGVLKLLRTLF